MSETDADNAQPQSEPPPAKPEPPPPAAPPPDRRQQLLRYAQELGLDLPEDVKPDVLVEAVRAREKLINSLPLTALAEIAAWAGLAIRDPNDRVELARQISHVPHMNFAGLSTPGLQALAMLRGCQVEPDDDRTALKRKIKRTEGLLAKFRRKKRAFFGKMIAKVFGERQDDYRSLPEETRPMSLKERIEQQGVVSGLKGKLRGAADDYVREKLDEIEARIDRKLDEIDHRLAEWRDREIVNRLRIIRITLFASIIVALLSLAYTAVKAKFPGWLP